MEGALLSFFKGVKAVQTLALVGAIDLVSSSGPDIARASYRRGADLHLDKSTMGIEVERYGLMHTLRAGDVEVLSARHHDA